MRLLFLEAEVTKSLSNLFKSGFVAFTREDTLVIDANKNKIIEGIDASARVDSNSKLDNVSEEDALAAAMIKDVGLYDDSMDEEGVLTFDAPLFDHINEMSEEEAENKASEILQDANSEAEQIIRNAHDEVEQLRAAAYDEAQEIKQQAQESGYNEGYMQGTQQAEQEINELRTQLQNQINDNEQKLRDDQEQLIVSTERKMVDWICKMVSSIVGVTIDGYDGVMLYMINKAMRELESSTRYIIRVSSEDYDNVMQRKSDIYGAMNPSIELEIFEDAKLEQYQCQIDTDNGIVDLSLDVQLDNLIKALKLMVQ